MFVSYLDPGDAVATTREPDMDAAEHRQATREDVALIVNEVLEKWLNGEGEPNVSCVYDINSGPCESFAADVVESVLERFPDTQIEVEDYENHLNLDGLAANGIHYYVKMGNWYFDASVPEGTFSPDCLPTCKSIRLFATPLNGYDEEEEEDAMGMEF